MYHFVSYFVHQYLIREQTMNQPLIFLDSAALHPGYKYYLFLDGHYLGSDGRNLMYDIPIIYRENKNDIRRINRPDCKIKNHLRRKSII